MFHTSICAHEWICQRNSTTISMSESLNNFQKCLRNTCLNPLPAPPPILPLPTAYLLLTGSYRSEQLYSQLSGLYGHSQRSRRDVWGPRHWRISFLLIFVQFFFLFFLLLHTCGTEASGGPQGEAGGPRGRVPDFSLCAVHLLPWRHQQRGGWALLQGSQLLYGWRGQTEGARPTGHR